jgi:hypothetical protein
MPVQLVVLHYVPPIIISIIMSTVLHLGVLGDIHKLARFYSKDSAGNATDIGRRAAFSLLQECRNGRMLVAEFTRFGPTLGECHVPLPLNPP